MENLSIIQRLSAETPKFWKRIQLLFLFFSLLLSYAFDAHVVPVTVFCILSGFFAGVALIAQLAVKDSTIIQQAIADPLSILDHLAELKEQAAQIKQAVTQPVKVTLDSVTDQISKVETPVATAVITEETDKNTPVVGQAEAPVIQLPVI